MKMYIGLFMVCLIFLGAVKLMDDADWAKFKKKHNCVFKGYDQMDGYLTKSIWECDNLEVRNLRHK